MWKIKKTDTDKHESLAIQMRGSNDWYSKIKFYSDWCFYVIGSQYFQRVTDEYLYSTDGPFSVDILKEMTSKSSRAFLLDFTIICSEILHENISYVKGIMMPLDVVSQCCSLCSLVDDQSAAKLTYAIGLKSLQIIIQCLSLEKKAINAAEFHFIFHILHKSAFCFWR